MIITGNLVDIPNREIRSSRVTIQDGMISAIEKIEEEVDSYILPGFIDAHIHIESSMLIPSQFSRLAVRHGTVATISDPHEIGNVLGVEGVQFMIDDAKTAAIKCFFGAPSCVPATMYETAGATIGIKEINQLLSNPDIYYLSEMMNYPGVFHRNEEVLHKIDLAKQYRKPIDGHAPGLRGGEMINYFNCGISTDHECFQYEEALEKAKFGVKILIREGSAAKNFETLIPLITEYPRQIMFCSDDKHPDDLVIGHINELVVRAIEMGYDLFDVLYAACIHPVEHYRIPVGLLQVGDPADFIVVENLQSFSIKQTIIGGRIAHGDDTSPEANVSCPNNFHRTDTKEADYCHEIPLGHRIRLIVAKDGELITGEKTILVDSSLPDIDADILKLAVINRYKNAPIAIAYIQGFGLKKGAIASSVAHDSHNIVAIGCSDRDLSNAVNLVIQEKGGISAACEQEELILPLPVAGIMSNLDGFMVAEKYSDIDDFVRNKLQAKLSSPFMTLSFMALLVIPNLKLSDLGLFDVNQFGFVPVIE